MVSQTPLICFASNTEVTDGDIERKIGRLRSITKIQCDLQFAAVVASTLPHVDRKRIQRVISSPRIGG